MNETDDKMPVTTPHPCRDSFAYVHYLLGSDGINRAFVLPLNELSYEKVRAQKGYSHLSEKSLKAKQKRSKRMTRQV